MKLTVYYDGQFWVGLLEVVNNGTLSAARYVFGAEPHDEELWAFVQNDLIALLNSVSTSVAIEHKLFAKRNAKRLARQATKEMNRPAVSSQAQAALQAQLEANKKTRVQISRAEKEAQLEMKYKLGREKAKKRHRGK
ncbi:MAG: YjdF family protein [Burkholderiales bacterium]|nr:YjdF family protein [Burkholderiales bacterium]